MTSGGSLEIASVIDGGSYRRMFCARDWSGVCDAMVVLVTSSSGEGHCSLGML